MTIYGGNYGWWVDNAAEKEMILEDLKAGKDVTRRRFIPRRLTSHGENDYGNTYVEINLTALQHLFFYKNGSLVVESDFVSGNLAKNHGTPSSSLGVTYKAKDAVLRGEDYESPVSFWMPFNGGVGMHDASWRSTFGGTIYKSGSHGCINLPYSAAKTIYENIEAGYPVLCL
ncbi:MAG: L,D-transpeptidase [Coprococcus eutactus]